MVFTLTLIAQNMRSDQFLFLEKLADITDTTATFQMLCTEQVAVENIRRVRPTTCSVCLFQKATECGRHSVPRKKNKCDSWHVLREGQVT